MERRGDNDERREGADYPIYQGGQPHHVQLCGHRSQRPAETERLFKRVKASRDICELRNMINVGYLITRWALERKECRGLHFTTDYPLHAYDKK